MCAYPPGAIDRFEALRAAGDVEQMLIAVFRELVQMPPEEIEVFALAARRVGGAAFECPLLPREMRTEEGYIFVPHRFRYMRTPTLLLVGGESPEREHVRFLQEPLGQDAVASRARH